MRNIASYITGYIVENDHEQFRRSGSFGIIDPV